jgi:glycosyltransferase involved in cell wall biosynthesis
VSSDPLAIAAVVLNYNYGRFLRKAIKSLLSQQGRSFAQIIVVDDGSTDDSARVIAEFGDQIESIALTNGGQLGAAVAGLELVRTPYVYFLDADDFVDPDATEIMTAALRPRAPVKVQFQLRCVNGGGTRSLDSVIPAYPGDYDSPDMIRDNNVLGFYLCPPTSGNVYSVNVLRSLPLGDLNPRDFIDGAPTLLMPYLGEVRSIPHVVANYRIHGENDSQQHAPTAQMFERDLQRHRARWSEVRQIAPRIQCPAASTTVNELEAHCLKTVLSGKRLSIADASAYCRRLKSSHISRRMQRLLIAWMMTVAVLPNPLARRLVVAKRSPVNRPLLLKKVLRPLLGVRQRMRV